MKRRTALVLVLVGLALSLAVPAVGNLLAGGKDVGTNVRFSKTTGPNVTFGESKNITTANPYAESDKLILQPYMNVTSTGDTEVTVDRFNGTWTNVSQLDVTGADLTIDPNDKESVTVGGDADSLAYRDSMAIDDGTVDFVYAGTSGTTTVTLRGLPANTGLAAVDRDTNTVLDVASTDANGVITFTGLSNSEHNVTLQTSDGGPIIDEDNINPEDGTELNDAGVTLSAPVSDPDFPGDSVTVTFSLDGSDVKTTTISSNTTVTSTHSGLTGGKHTWTVEATDDFGQTATTETFTFYVPDTLYIRNVSDNSLITGATVTVQLYGSDNTITETTTTGKLNMSGLPVSDPMLITAEASNYYKRQAYLKSIYQQNTVYLLDSTIATNTIRFTLDDKTGDFPPEDSTLYITRGVSGDGTNDYKIVASGQFGVKGVTEELKTGQRYRLVVEGATGERRILGGYTPTIDETVPLTIGRVNITGNVRGGVAFGATTVKDSGNAYVRYQYRDAQHATDWVNVTVYNVTGTRTQVYNQNHTSVNGPISVLAPVSTTNAEYEIVYNASRSGAPDRNGVAYAGEVPNVAEDFGLDPTVRTLLGFAAVIGVMGLLVIINSAIASAVTVGTAGFLTMTGFLSLHPIQLGIAGVIALLYLIGLPGRP